MKTLSEEGHRIVSEIAERYGVSTAAVAHLLVAIMAGNGSQAQFNHPDLGGMGQWSQGGMTMVGDMFNHGLKSRVDQLCNELAQLVRRNDLMAPPASFSQQSQYQGSGQHQAEETQGDGYSGNDASLFVPGSRQTGGGWPAELGQPSSSGAQNNLRYAFFPATRRLAIDLGGRVTVYDTRDHQIGGFSQQQGGDQSITFTSQYGLVRVADLDVVPAADERREEPPASAEPAAAAAEPVERPQPPEPAQQNRQPEATSRPAASQPVPSQPAPRAAPVVSSDDIIDKIERLAGLHGKGILTDEEYQSKKAELLSRL